MNCPKCGAIVLKGDVVCKKCGAPLMEAADAVEIEDVCRSRAMLLFKAWVGATSGMHLKWLGYDDEAAEVASRHGIMEQFGALIKGFWNPMEWMKLFGVIFYQCFICIGIIFGMYRTDANGHPVRWITKKKH